MRVCVEREREGEGEGEQHRERIELALSTAASPDATPMHLRERSSSAHPLSGVALSPFFATALTPRQRL